MYNVLESKLIQSATIFLVIPKLNRHIFRSSYVIGPGYGRINPQTALHMHVLYHIHNIFNIISCLSRHFAIIFPEWPPDSLRNLRVELMTSNFSRAVGAARKIRSKGHINIQHQLYCFDLGVIAEKCIRLQKPNPIRGSRLPIR